MNKKLLAFVLILLWGPLRPLFAFNLWDDIKQQTQWTFGNAAAGGTAFALKSDDSLNLKTGDLVASALASISQYRFLSFWYGANQIPQPSGGPRLIDTAKLGFNLSYLFVNFANQPPELLKHLVIGPSLSYSIITTPRVFVPFFDLQYQFGAIAAQKTTSAP